MASQAVAGEISFSGAQKLRHGDVPAETKQQTTLLSTQRSSNGPKAMIQRSVVIHHFHFPPPQQLTNHLSQDWTRLSQCIAPTVRIDYRSFLNKLWPALPSSEYLAMISSTHVLGDPLLRTQHFIGQSKWEKVSEEEVIGYHQMRVPHQRYTGDEKGGLGETKLKGHAHGMNKHWYRKIEGSWKFAGLAPVIRWGEFEFDRIFESGREEHGEAEVAETGGVGKEGDNTAKGEDVSAGLGQHEALTAQDGERFDLGTDGSSGVSQTNGMDGMGEAPKVMNGMGEDAAVAAFQQDVKMNGSHSLADMDKTPLTASVLSVPGDSPPMTDAGGNDGTAAVKDGATKEQAWDKMMGEGVATIG